MAHLVEDHYWLKADKSRWEIAKAKESVEVDELWYMNDDIPDEPLFLLCRKKNLMMVFFSGQ